MIVVDNILVSDELVQKQFVCDLHKCKGGCCEDGAAGAPLDDDELKTINKIYNTITPYLSEKSIAVIEQKGKYVYNTEYGWVTPTLDTDNEICVYANRDKEGIIKCAFEQAYYDGKTDWKKPISCHLYPVIIYKGKYADYDRVNYEPREKMCSPGCALGDKLKVPVYQFLKEPLTRKYGPDFYDLLHAIFSKQNENTTP